MHKTELTPLALSLFPVALQQTVVPSCSNRITFCGGPGNRWYQGRSCHYCGVRFPAPLMAVSLIGVTICRPSPLALNRIRVAKNQRIHSSSTKGHKSNHSGWQIDDTLPQNKRLYLLISVYNSMAYTRTTLLYK